VRLLVSGRKGARGAGGVRSNARERAVLFLASLLYIDLTFDPGVLYPHVWTACLAMYRP